MSGKAASFDRFWSHAIGLLATVHYFSKQRGTGIDSWADGRQSHANQYLTLVPYQSAPKKAQLLKPAHKAVGNQRPSLLDQYDENTFQPFIPKEFKPPDPYRQYEQYQLRNQRPHYRESYYINPEIHRPSQSNRYSTPVKLPPSYEDQTTSPLSYYIENAKTVHPHVEISPVSPNKTVPPTRQPQTTTTTDKEEDYEYYEQYTVRPTPNKYENVHNPFADANFDFDEFLDRFRGSSKDHPSSSSSSSSSSQYSAKPESDVNQSFAKPERNHYPETVQTYNSNSNHRYKNSTIPPPQSPAYEQTRQTITESSPAPPVELRTPVPFLTSTLKPLYSYTNEKTKPKPNVTTDSQDYGSLDDDDEYYDDYDYEYDDKEQHKDYVLPKQSPPVAVKHQERYSAKYLENTTSGKSTSPSPRTTARPNILTSTTTSTTRPIYTIRQRVRSTTRTTSTTPRVAIRQRHKNDETRPDLHYAKDR